jgi:hypothetical protein
VRSLTGDARTYWLDHVDCLDACLDASSGLPPKEILGHEQLLQPTGPVVVVRAPDEPPDNPPVLVLYVDSGRRIGTRRTVGFTMTSRTGKHEAIGHFPPVAPELTGIRWSPEQGLGPNVRRDDPGELVHRRDSGETWCGCTDVDNGNAVRDQVDACVYPKIVNIRTQLYRMFTGDVRGECDD